MFSFRFDFALSGFGRGVWLVRPEVFLRLSAMRRAAWADERRSRRRERISPRRSLEFDGLETVVCFLGVEEGLRGSGRRKSVSGLCWMREV